MASFTDHLVFDEALIRRFDINGPRYTSYPTADRFGPEFGADAYRERLERRRDDPQDRKPFSLYFHLPFCTTICYYCACNKIITKDHGRSAKYLKYLGRELALQTGFLHPDDNTVEQLHWGGGTPTFLSHDEMRQLMDMTRRHFRLLDGGEYSIEVDPRKVDRATVDLLAELGFNRMSLGVQDFDERVQQAVNPHPERGGDLRGDGRGAGQRLQVDQHRPDLRPAEAVGGRFRPHARPRAGRPARTGCRSTTTRTCRRCSSRSGASSTPTCRRRMRACRSWRGPSTS